jgi:hypothetical protein
MTVWSESDGCYYDITVYNVTGPSATHVITDGEGWRQKRHPLDAMRRAGGDGNTPAAVKKAQVRRYHSPRKAVDAYANVFRAKGSGWRLMTREHPNAVPCPTCADGFLRPKDAGRQSQCRACRGQQVQRVCGSGHTYFGAKCWSCLPKCARPGCTSLVGIPERTMCSRCHDRASRRKRSGRRVA